MTRRQKLDAFAKLVEARNAIMNASDGVPLVLVRLAIPRWNVIQWWLARNARDVRTLSSYNSSAGSPAAEIKAAMRGATARTLDFESEAERVVQLHGASGDGTIRQAAEIRWTRGGPRLIGYDYTGSRLRDHQRAQARIAATEAEQA